MQRTPRRSSSPQSSTVGRSEVTGCSCWVSLTYISLGLREQCFLVQMPPRAMQAKACLGGVDEALFLVRRGRDSVQRGAECFPVFADRTEVALEIGRRERD